MIAGLVSTSILVIRHPRAYPDRLFLLSALISTFLISHVTSAISWHNFSGVLPIMAALTAFGVLDLVKLFEWLLNDRRSKVLVAPIAIAVCFVAITINYASAGWGLFQDQLGGSGLFGMAPRWGASASPPYPIGGNWQMENLLREILDNPKCREAECQIAHLSHRHNYYGDEALTYSMVQYFPALTRKNTGSFYPERTLTIQRIGRGRGGHASWLLADFSIFLSDSIGTPEGGEVTNAGSKGYEAAVVTWMKTSLETDSESPYRIVLHAPLPNGLWVTLVKRTRDISREQALAIIDTLALTQAEKATVKADLKDGIGG